MADTRKSISEPVLAWLSGGDTGVSSLAIVTVLGSSEVMIYTGRRGGLLGNHPHDPADLGRCIRLLDIAPEYRTRLDLMRAVSPEWNALVEHWAELEALYREEAPSGRASKCYDRMRELIESAREG